MISPLSKVQKQMEMTHFGKEDAAQGVMNFVEDGIHQRVATSDQGSRLHLLLQNHWLTEFAGKPSHLAAAGASSNQSL
jgi:hypothetical protein